MNDLLEQLNNRYHLTINSENNAAFFTRLFNYMDLIDKNESLNDIHKHKILAEYPKYIEKRTELEKLVISDSSKVVEKMEKVLRKVGAKNATVIARIKDYKAWKRNKIDPQDKVTERMISNVFTMLAYAYDDPELKPIVLEYALIQDNGILGAWKWSEHKLKLDLEKQKLERLKTTKAWYHADKIAWFHEVFEKYEELYLKEIESERYMHVAGLGMAMGEINAVLTYQEPEKFYIFPPNELKYSIKEYHISFIKRAKETIKILELEESTENQTSLEQPVKLSGHILHVFGKELEFSRSKFRYDILDRLINENNEWFLEDLYDDIEKGAKPVGWKKKFKDACDGINRRIKNVTNQESFIVCRDERVAINTNYTHMLSV